MKKFLSVALVGVFLASLLSACTPIQTKTNRAQEGARADELRNSQFLPGDAKQQALVIGNASYQRKPLANPVNDATDMAQVLKKQGFSVALKTNLTGPQMAEAIRQFENRLSATQKAVGLFYYSGHGAQLDGKNYLIPIDDAKIEYVDDVEQKAVQVDEKILAQMQRSHKGLNIIILDACRDNPYPRKPGKSGNQQDGLAQMTPPEGAIIAYATAPHEIALDVSNKNDRNSLYTKHLLNAIQPKKRIDNVFIDVRNAVAEESEGQQVPWYQVSVTKQFCFGGCP